MIYKVELWFTKTLVKQHFETNGTPYISAIVKFGCNVVLYLDWIRSYHYIGTDVCNHKIWMLF